MPTPMRQARSSSEVMPAMMFTGERINRIHNLYLDGRPVELPRSCLRLMILLVLTRAETDTGYLHAGPVAIWRLRRAMAKVVGEDRVKALIETGSGTEYRLTIPRAALKTQIGVDHSFYELVELKIVTAKHAARLKRIGHAVQSK